MLVAFVPMAAMLGCEPRDATCLRKGREGGESPDGQTSKHEQAWAWGSFIPQRKPLPVGFLWGKLGHLA